MRLRKGFKRVLVAGLAVAMLLQTPNISAFAQQMVEQNIVTIGAENEQTVTVAANEITDLNQTVTDVVIEGEVNDAIEVIPGKTYTLMLSFKEALSKQFANGQPLVYQMPAGVIPVGTVGGNTFDMNILGDDNNTYTIKDNTFAVNQVDGTITVNFNLQDSNATWLLTAQNVWFTIGAGVQFSPGLQPGKIPFGNNVEKEIAIGDPSLAVDKSSSFDATTGKMNYTITVKSEGNNSNVVISDAMTANGLFTMDNNVTATSNMNGGTVTGTYTPNGDGKGFTYTIGQMLSGEVITLNYSATVDFNQVVNGTIVQDGSKNNVKVDSDSPKEAVEDNEWAYVSYDVVEKSHGALTGDGAVKTINWTITVNANRWADMSGQTITDAITDTHELMQYAGTGITIERTDEGGNVTTETIPWANVNQGEKNWVYTVPSDAGKSSYKITYQTQVDTNGQVADFTVNNKVKVGVQEETDTVVVSVAEEYKAKLSKEVVSSNSEEIQWKITASNVSGSGTSSFVLTDELPQLYINNKWYMDELKDGSLTVSGLLDGEGYDMSYGADSQNQGKALVLAFYHIENGSRVDGLKATADGNARDIVVNITTKVNDEWVKDSNVDGMDVYTRIHHNDAILTAGVGSITANAQVEILSKDIKKEGWASYIYGHEYPVYDYKIILRAPDADGIVITDVFDTEVFKLYEAKAVFLGGGDAYNQYYTDANTKITTTETATGLSFKMDSFPKDASGNLYNFYKIEYTLTVKDDEALTKLRQRCLTENDGKTDLKNVAAWVGEDLTDEATVEYEYFPLSKEAITWDASNTDRIVANEIEYTVKINPAGVLMNGGNELTVTDTMSDTLRLMPNTVTVKVDGVVQNIPFNVQDNVMTLTVPDGKPIQITYKAQVFGGLSDRVMCNNSVAVTGFSGTETDSNEVVIGTEPGGGGSVTYIVLKKHVFGNINSAALEGAKFVLEVDENGDGNWKPVYNNSGVQVSVVTGTDGTAELNGRSGNFAFAENVLYRVIEVEAPEGYAIDPTPIEFMITAYPEEDNEYITGSVLPIANAIENFHIVKKDKDTQSVLEGAVFSLTGNIGGVANNTVEVVTDVNGIAAFSKLVPGVYTLKEVTAPAGYVLDTREYTIEIDNNLNVVSNTNGLTFSRDGAGKFYADLTNEKTPVEGGYLTIVKSLQGISASEVQNLKFTITDSSGKVIEEVSFLEFTNESGKYVYKLPEALPVGTYTVTETNTAITGYTESVTYEVLVDNQSKSNGTTTMASADVENGKDTTVVFINTYTPSLTVVNVNKIWDDNNNQDGKRPASITIRLHADGTEIDHKNVTASDGWQWSFDNLPKYKNGTLIKYTITEDSVEDYTTVVSGYNVTNRYTPGKTSVTVNKVWDDSNNQDGKRPESVQVQLFADSVEKGNEVTLSATNNWTHTWTDLDQKKAGAVIQYTVEEVNVPTGYTATVTGTPQIGFVITNSYAPQTVQVEGIKTWADNNNQDGKRPASLTVHLLADGMEIDQQVVTASDNWQWSFTDLPKYADGKEIIYSIAESGIEDYIPTINGYNITNTYTPGKTFVTVNKVWADGNDQDGLRPESVQVQLLADGVAYGSAVTLNEANSWSYMWTDLDQKKAGVEVQYTVEEINVPTGYTATVNGTAKDGYSIINSHTPETIEVSGSKTWVDDNNQAGKRPASIIIHLLADGVQIDSKTVTATENWSWEFTDLNKYANGVEVRYTITEDKVADYTTVVAGYNVTNTYVKPGTEPTPSTKPVEPTPSTEPGTEPTPSTEPGTEPTPSTEPGTEPTPSTKPVDPTPSQKPGENPDPTAKPGTGTGSGSAITPPPAVTQDPSSEVLGDGLKPAPTSVPTVDIEVTIPKTADEAPVLLWVALMLVGLTGMTMVYVVIRKQRRKDR